MEKMSDALEQHAGRLSADLSTEAALLQETANNILNYDKGSEEYQLGMERLEGFLAEFNPDYVEAEAVVAISDRLDLGKADENREEEVRLAKEKYFSSNIANPYSGRVGSAINAHQDRQQEAMNGEILKHGTPIQSLRNNLEQYKELLSALEDTFQEIETKIKYEEREYDSEFIENSESTDVQENWEIGNMWETI